MICQLIQKKPSNVCYKCAKTARNVTFWTKKKVKGEDSDLKICSPAGQIDRKNIQNMSKLLPNWRDMWFRKKRPICDKDVPDWLFHTNKKGKQRESNLTHKSHTKKNSKLLGKWFVNSFRINPPICAWNLPKLPKMPLSETREKSKRRMAISKLALQQVKLTANTYRNWINFSQIEVASVKCGKVAWNVTFWNQEESQAMGWRFQKFLSCSVNWPQNHEGGD